MPLAPSGVNASTMSTFSSYWTCLITGRAKCPTCPISSRANASKRHAVRRPARAGPSAAGAANFGSAFGIAAGPLSLHE
jgi:hypothetical protein